MALVSIPEGMAYALVAGVDPIYGLYTGMLTTIVASLLSSTSLLVVTLTNAMALVTGEQLAGLGPDADPVRALFTLTLLVGVIMAVLGVLKLGSIIRFVSREVMSGFVFATALLIVLGQFKHVVGYESTLDTNKLFQTLDILRHVQDWVVPSAILGFSSIAILFLLKRTPLRKFADILVIILASLFILIVGWDDVQLVADIASVPSGLAALPRPVLPDLSLVPVLIGGALAAAVVGLAESSGIGAAYPNPDGSRANMSRDFTAQGMGNIVGSFFQALPAGGSLSRTGVNVSGGARTRWAGVYSGVVLALILILFGRYAELIPMPALGALLVVIGLEVMFREGRDLARAWEVSRLNTGIAFITIAVGVFDDLTAAIFTGVVLSLLLYAYVSSSSVKLVELSRQPDGRWVEGPLPETYPPDKATVIGIDGNAYFASVYSASDVLPQPEELQHSAIVVRIRDRKFASLTGLDWLEEYDRKLRETGNLLFLSGVDPDLLPMLEATGVAKLVGTGQLFLAEPELFASTGKALAAAEAWLAQPVPPKPTAPAATGE